MNIYIRQPLGFSEIGRKDNQEDRVYPSFESVTKDQKFFILCDGMGGHDHGEVASTLVSEALGHYFESHIPEDGIVTADMFNEALASAYDALDEADNGEDQKKMGTTMTCLYLHRCGYLVAHIGDSRIYHIRPTASVAGKALGVRYQSSDHSLVNDLLKIGELTEEEAVNFPQKNVITRAMQPHLSRRYKADVYSFSDVKAGDYFFLCCDGIIEQLTNQRLCEILGDGKLNDKEKLAAIKAESDGKTKDNYTCWLIPVDKVDAEMGDVVDETAVMTIIEDGESITETPKIPENRPCPNVEPVQEKKKKLPIRAIIILAALLVAAASIGYLFRSCQSDETKPANSPQQIIDSLKGQKNQQEAPPALKTIPLDDNREQEDAKEASSSIGNSNSEESTTGNDANDQSSDNSKKKFDKVKHLITPNN